jgi:phage terminase large subunit
MSVPYDATKPVYTFWDLGFGDATSIWFAQSIGFEFRCIDYYQSSGKNLPHYLAVLQSRGYVYDTDWLPHDAQAHELGSGRSIEELMRAAGRKVGIVKKLSVADGINAARTIFPQCYFDREKCADGLQGLRHYQWGEPSAAGVPRREPLHDWASHPADAFRYLAVTIREPKLKPKPLAVRREPAGMWG